LKSDVSNPTVPRTARPTATAASARRIVIYLFVQQKRARSSDGGLDLLRDVLLEQGVHPKIVAERLGHANITTTLQVYSHVTETMQRHAAATLDRLLGGA
jgi:integrase